MGQFREYQFDGKPVRAQRYQPGRPGVMAGKLGDLGIRCVQIHPATQAIVIDADPDMIEINGQPARPQDDPDGLLGSWLITPGDWVVVSDAITVSIVPSSEFDRRAV